MVDDGMIAAKEMEKGTNRISGCSLYLTLLAAHSNLTTPPHFSIGSEQRPHVHSSNTFEPLWEISNRMKGKQLVFPLHSASNPKLNNSLDREPSRLDTN